MRLPASLFLLTTLYALSQPAWSANDWGLCSVPVIHRQPSTDYSVSATDIRADKLFSEQRDMLRFEGNVELQRSRQSLQADYLEYRQQQDRLQARGNLRFSDDLFSLNALQLDMDNSRDYFIFETAEFQLYENHLRGTASIIEQIDADHRLLQDVRYTTCDPQDDHWSLSASTLQLDQASGMGTAKHTVLRIGKVPVLYFPWFRFPITDERLSGLLPPTLAHSENDGVILALPFYWNQAPNYDMTITPTIYENRGVQLNTENRYLFDQHEGSLNLSWLDDDISDDQRWFRQWRHQAQGGAGVQTSILIQKVSDDDFFDEFALADGPGEVDHLASSIRTTAPLGEWSSSLLFEQYQTINPAVGALSRPYKRLPQITLNRRYINADGQTYLDWQNELVLFDREQGVTGQRLNMRPQVSYPMEGDYFFVKPALQLDLTRYSLDNSDIGDNDIERSIPLLSIDSGLFFDRLAGSKGWLQTLEPRLYLLYVPYQNQDDIPNFDSALLAESYGNLFTNNRFSGRDRIGDSKQVSLGLTSRLLNPAGREVVSASIGQAYYHQDRRISLNGQTDSSDKSSLISLLSVRPDDYWQIQLSSVYDQQEKESEQTDIALRRHKAGHVFNLEYHLRRDSLEQTTLSLVYPYSQRWRLYAKQQHSIREDKPVQNLFGVTYDSCCWRFEMLYEEDSDISFTETDRSIYFQLTFKGLGSAGNDISSVLEDAILGYQPPN